MPFDFFETHSKEATAEYEEPTQAEIERQIAKLKEDSARDVERQLAQQRVASRKGEVKEELKKVVEDVEKDFAPARKAAEQEVEMIVNDVDSIRRHRGPAESADVSNGRL